MSADKKELKDSSVSWLYRNLNLEKVKRKFDKEKIFAPQKQEILRLENVRVVGSYNWSPESSPERPEIVVPGAPHGLMKRNWTQDVPLKSDSEISETHLVDENRFMIPIHPLEPLFASVGTVLDYQTFDFVSDASNLKDLFNFCKKRLPSKFRSSGRKSEQETPFRINVEKIGRLVCLVRICENVTRKTEKCVFAKDFERAITGSARDHLTSGSYRQVSAYTLGDMKFLVRNSVNCVNSVGKLKQDQEPGYEELPSDSNLRCFRYGSTNQNFHTIQLSTRREGREFFSGLWPTMFFSAKKTAVVAFHQGGKISGNATYRPPVTVLATEYPERYTGVWRFDFKGVEEKCGGFPTEQMARFLTLMEQILEFVRESAQGKKWALVYNGRSLQMYEMDPETSETAVPESYRKLILKKKVQKIRTVCMRKK